MPGARGEEVDIEQAITAEDFFTDIFKRYLANWNVVISLRQVVRVALPLAQSELASLHKEQMAAIAEHPMAQRLIVDKDGTHSPLSPELQRIISQGATDTAHKNAEAAVDAASFVFAHSIIDDCALAYCRVCELAKPEDWEPIFAKRTVTFRALMSKGKDEIRMDMIEARLKELERGPLLIKIKTLLSLCKPAKTTVRLEATRSMRNGSKRSTASATASFMKTPLVKRSPA